MKIFLPFSPKDIGGTSSFAQKFKSGMEEAGHEVFFEKPADYDILFLIVQAPFTYLWEAKKKNIPIVQRLDGVYYWSVVGIRFPLYNLKAFIIRHFFTDYTVYQSQYSAYVSKIFLFPKWQEKAVTIYNGVNTALFNPDGSKKELQENPRQQIFFTASEFRRKDQIMPIIEALNFYKKYYSKNFLCYIAGSFSREVASIPIRYQNCKNLIFLGKIKNSDLPLYERSADVFLFTYPNPACPNNIIEAIACGLPIVGIADGAMSEIIENGKEGLLLEASGQAFWKKRIYDTKVLAKHIHLLLEKRELFGVLARRKAEQYFSLEIMITHYVSFFEKII